VSRNAPNGLEQRQWQDLTTWTDETPTLAEAWSVLSNDQLPAVFLDAVNASQHVFVRQLRRSSQTTGLERRREWNNRFANLVSGRFTELLFDNAYRARLESLSLKLVPKVNRRDWHDYWIVGDEEAFQVAINVKNAGVQFRQAATFVGLDPDDTLPIATYKIFGSSGDESQLPLVYVYLVDWLLLPRLRSAYWDSLNDGERALFKMTASFRGMPRDLEDDFIEATVGGRLYQLTASVGYDIHNLTQLPFRAISGAKCKSIFYTDHSRSPYVFRQRMNTDPNVHVSVRSDTLQFDEFIARWLSTSNRRAELLAGLRQSSLMTIPDPPM
jgi:hypothetical protein